jgi:hypothetical protein
MMNTPSSSAGPWPAPHPFGNNQQAKTIEHLVLFLSSIWMSILLENRRLPFCLVVFPVVAFCVTILATEDEMKHVASLYAMVTILEALSMVAWRIAGALFDEKSFFLVIGPPIVFCTLFGTSCYLLRSKLSDLFVTAGTPSVPVQEVAVDTETQDDNESIISEQTSNDGLESVSIHSNLPVKTDPTPKQDSTNQNDKPADEDNNSQWELALDAQQLGRGRE